MKTIVAIGIAIGIGACTSSGGDYTEQKDATNNWNVGGTPENTGLTIGATGSITIAGEVNDGHYDSEDLDNDAYIFNVSAESVGTLTLTGPEANAALVTFKLSIIDSSDHGSGYTKVGAPGSSHLLPGTYTLEVQAQNPTPITSSYPYTVEIAATGS